MSRMWEVDPETRTKLVQISKTNGNDRCCDCGAPSPQWASPKFGTFICLNCAGTHRGLGVHISFVRSITMDAFKHGEIQRMELGGNDPWKEFYDTHTVTVSEGRTFEDSTIKERYEGDAGEEWKERLTCKVEGKEYVPGQEKKNSNASRSSTPMSVGSGVGSLSGVRNGSPAPSSIKRTDSLRSGVPTKKEQNEAYFARMGSENANRSEALPPSQAGSSRALGVDYHLVLTIVVRRGLGALAGLEAATQRLMISRRILSLLLRRDLDGLRPLLGNMPRLSTSRIFSPRRSRYLAESEFAAQARLHAATLGQNLQTGARTATDQFTRFVEGEESSRGQYSRVEPERKDFWDDFSSLGNQDQAAGGHRRSGSRSDLIGTTAMRKGPASSLLQNSSTAASGETAPTGLDSAEGAASSSGKNKDDWDDDW
ncbi:hypothetical protein N7468_008067 [Penicillium chermesinum]|uniref:Arf-GAP domain-containing protein n=1 Tax=Penicillium chermesinum TaxID=63820 RepID=A0A9W9NP07_9EURO|nr:uncharacterized protein N7468_008067 [Penicillium chermesinum]KAJ5223525.1 hypothetical protein N7468_008067 [Penicillium chermesinum]